MKIQNPQQIEEYYQALIHKNADYVGVFYVGVKTTSIFCIATCRARKPKEENVEFFSEFKDALENGYRPCKVCKPTENANQAPSQVQKAIDLVKENPKEKITDKQLQGLDIAPNTIRRWFKAHYGITFHAFQRMYRINYAFDELQNGQNTTQTAFDMGYDSLSGFGYTYKKIIGKSPHQSKNTEIIVIDRLTTPIGAMLVCASQKGICLLEFTNRKMLETEFRDIQKRLNAVILTGENEHIKQLKQELQEYFEGKRTTFNVALHPVGTDFQNIVWDALKKIPYGITTTYSAQAQSIQKPNAVRAVASANGCNKIAIIIPCHRVIGSNGNLTGYAGGLERKKWLLDFERKTALEDK